MKENQKRNADDAMAAMVTRPIATAGEVFADGSAIELIGGTQDGIPALTLWDGAKEIIGAHVERNGRIYAPAPINISILKELTLPTQGRPYGTTRKIFAETCKLFEDFAGLPENSASLVGRFVLSTWVVEAVPVAPALVLIGPDTMRGNRLIALLHCLCRHGLRMTGLTPAGLRSLPSGVGFTMLISQPTIGGKLERMLDDASRRDQKIPYRGGLLDLFGAQVIHVESIPFGESLTLRSIRIPMIPGGAQLPVFDSDAKHRIAAEFQAKLLSFRRANLDAASKLQFDASKFTFALRDLARSLAAGTPHDLVLQAEVFDLLREKDDEIRAGKWIELNVVAAESMLVACQESPGGCKYVGEVATIAQGILRGRGGDSTMDPGAFGKRLKLLGFRAESRDAQGIKVRLTEDACRRAQQLAHDLGAPQVMDGAPTEVAETGRKRNSGRGKLGV